VLKLLNPAHPAVCRDSSGTVIKVISVINSSCDPTYGETLAAPLASSLSASLKLSSFSLEGDFQVVISALQHPSFVQDWKIVDRILLQNRFLYFLLPPLSSWMVRKVYRNTNFCAHRVAY
jgi:hypothetical protein